MSNSVKDDVVNELHKPSRKHFKRRRVIVKGLNDLWQANLVEIIPYWRFNKGYKYLLVVINVFSKFLWIEPLKSKTAQDVTMTMREILKNVKNTLKNLQTDLGKDLCNKEFKKLMNEYNINHYNTFSILKASVVERVNRTIKNLMRKKFSLRGNYKWFDILDKIVQKYNNTTHSTMKKNLRMLVKAIKVAF